MEDKKVMKTFRFSRAAVLKLRELAEATKCTETEVLQRKILSA